MPSRAFVYLSVSGLKSVTLCTGMLLNQHGVALCPHVELQNQSKDTGCHEIPREEGHRVEFLQ